MSRLNKRQKASVETLVKPMTQRVFEAIELKISHKIGSSAQRHFWSFQRLKCDVEVFRVKQAQNLCFKPFVSRLGND